MNGILIKPLSPVDKESIVYSREVLEEKFNTNTFLLNTEQIPLNAFDHRRKQYNAEILLRYIENLVEEEGLRNNIIIAITRADGYVPGLNFVFGIASLGGGVCIVFTRRLRYYCKDESTYKSRVRKEVLHEVGHAVGLEHCDTPGCVMNFSNSVFDVDLKEDRYCIKCSLKLRLLLNRFKI